MRRIMKLYSTLAHYSGRALPTRYVVIVIQLLTNFAITSLRLNNHMYIGKIGKTILMEIMENKWFLLNQLSKYTFVEDLFVFTQIVVSIHRLLRTHPNSKIIIDIC